MATRRIRMMMRVALLLAASASLSDVDQTLRADNEQVSIYYAPSSPTFSLREPLTVEVRIKNGGSELLIGDLGANFKGNFVLTVTPPEGTVIEPLHLAPSGFASAGHVTLRPGDQYTGTLVLNDWYDFSRVGTYTIGIALNGAFRTVAGSSVDTSTAETVRVQIVARDEKRLRAVCEKLEATIETAGSARVALDAARALSYVSDPIAVSYIRQVLSQTTRVDHILIDSLARIGNTEARQVLAGVAQEPGERAEMARGALARLVR